MKEIYSKDNRIFKDTCKLSQKKYRDRENLYIVEGENLVSEALKYARVRSIFLSENSVERYKEIGIISDDLKCETFVVENRLFRKLAQTESSQGILAVVEKNVYDGETIAKYLDNDSNFVVLDRLQDPGNIGTIIRTSEGAGYGGIVVLKGTADVYSPKTIRAAAGSVFRNPIIHVEDNRDLKELCDRFGKKLTVTCFDTDKYYFDEDLSENIALVIGNEGNGVSEELMEMADVRIKIPMEGNLESLNASVAAGILMYERKRNK